MDELPEHIRKLPRVNIRFCGQGGQGIVLMGYIYGNAAILQGFNAVQTQEYGPESRGSPVKSDLVLQPRGVVKFPLFNYIDILVAMTQECYDRNYFRVNATGAQIIDTEMVKIRYEGPRTFGIPATAIAERKFGKTMVANIIMLGYITRVTGGYIDKKFVMESIKQTVRKKYVEMNLRAFEEGLNWNPDGDESQTRTAESADNIVEKSD